MRKLLIGPALTGVGWAAGSYYGREAQQVVHKGTGETYEGVSNALGNIPEKGTSEVEGRAVPYELRVDRQPDRQLIVHVLFGGREGGRTEIDFTPKGQNTVMTAKAHGDRAVLGDALAGTSKARLAYAPDWMLNLLAVRPLLQQLAQQIETGQQASIGDVAQDDYQAQLPKDQEKQIEAWRQYDASRPMVDPDADAHNYMQSGKGE